MRCRLFRSTEKTRVRFIFKLRVRLSHCSLFSLQTIRFPVKMTSPPTAILYITEDFEYMTQLKETLHVKEVEIGKENNTCSNNFLVSIYLSTSSCSRRTCTSQTRTSIRWPTDYILDRLSCSNNYISFIFIKNNSQ